MPSAEPRQQRLERVVGDRARAADAVDLAGVLHPAQLLDQRARRHELDAVERRRVARAARAQVTLCSSSPSARTGARPRPTSSVALRGAR